MSSHVNLMFICEIYLKRVQYVSRNGFHRNLLIFSASGSEEDSVESIHHAKRRTKRQSTSDTSTAGDVSFENSRSSIDLHSPTGLNYGPCSKKIRGEIVISGLLTELQ